MENIRELKDCPLCEGALQNRPDLTDRDTALVRCPSCGTFEITEECMIFSDAHAKLRQRAAKLSEWVKKKNAEGVRWPVIK